MTTNIGLLLGYYTHFHLPSLTVNHTQNHIFPQPHTTQKATKNNTPISLGHDFCCIKIMTIEERITRLEDIEAIRQLQAKYQRCVDMRNWEELADCFTTDAVSEYDSGQLSYHGRDAIINFLKNALTKSISCSHMIHGGEIELTDAEHATGIWYLEDYLLHKWFFVKMHGAAIYHISYRKTNNKWHISRIGYERNYQYFERRPLLNLFTLAKHSPMQPKFK